MPVKRRRPTTTIIGIILVLVGLATAVYGIGILLLIIGGVIIVLDQRRLKCPNCQTRGRLAAVRSEVLNEERGVGLVTRADRIQTQCGGQRENTVVRRQERVPIMRRRVRTYYKCGLCGGDSWVDRVTEAEDFSPPQPVVREREVITREVLIQCRSCGARYPQGTPRCLNCGANL